MDGSVETEQPQSWIRRLLASGHGDEKGSTVVRAARVGAGSIFLVLGILGFFLPVLQGFLFTVVGLTLLSTESTRAKALLDWMHRRFDAVRHLLHRGDEHRP